MQIDDHTPLLLRPALYYPYTHFRDLNWLKETLLSFRQVRRMAPEGFSFNDHPDVRSLRELEVKGLGPMIDDEFVDQVWPELAQERLYKWLNKQPRHVLSTFDRGHTQLEHPDPDGFQILAGKFSSMMLEFLQQHALAWRPQRGGGPSSPSFALHPRLGEALLSVMAIAIAERKALNIVTPDTHLHHALITRREEDVLDSLAQRDSDAGEEPPIAEDLATDAAQLVIHKYIDLSKVSLAEVAAVVRDGNDFQRFRVRLQELATDAGLSSVRDAGERAKQVRELADAARTEWKQYRRGLGSFAKIFLETAVEEKAETAIEAGATAAIGLEPLGAAAIGAGLAVGAVCVGFKSLRKFVQRRKSDPYRYLTRLTEHGATLIADVPGTAHASH